MLNVKSQGAFTALLSALAASLCCITPVIALVAGSSSLAANFSWLEPARPFLIGLSIGVLALAWYFQLKPATTTHKDCCETTENSTFLQSKTFLSIVTFFALLLIAFPLYASMFYSIPKTHVTSITGTSNEQQFKFTIQGMTCAGCEEHVNKELSKEIGVLAYTTSYKNRGSLVSFDPTKTNEKSIAAAIDRSGYKVKTYELIATPNTTDSLHYALRACSKKKDKSCCNNEQ